MTAKKPAKAPANPITPEAADAFHMHVLKWQELLGLLDWRIVRSMKPAARANMAEIKPQVAHRLASYHLGRDFGSAPVNDQSLEEIAVHELLHVRLAELIAFVRAEAPDEVLAAAEHAVINALVRLLVPKS